MNRILLALALFALPACALFQGQDLGYRARVYVSSPDPAAMPLAMVAVSTRGVWAYGEAAAVAELYDASGIDLREPWNYDAGRAVWRPFEGEEIECDLAGRNFPIDVAFAYRGDEAARWGIRFFNPDEDIQ